MELVKETEDYLEYLLPYGWKKIGRKKEKKWNFSIINPNGKQFFSDIELYEYLDNNPDVECDRTVTKTWQEQYNDVIKGEFSSNLSNVHEGIRPHKCVTCDATFRDKRGLKYHIQSFHEGKKPHKCIIQLRAKQTSHSHISLCK